MDGQVLLNKVLESIALTINPSGGYVYRRILLKEAVLNDGGERGSEMEASFLRSHGLNDKEIPLFHRSLDSALAAERERRNQRERHVR